MMRRFFEESKGISCKSEDNGDLLFTIPLNDFKMPISQMRYRSHHIAHLPFSSPVVPLTPLVGLFVLLFFFPDRISFLGDFKWVVIVEESKPTFSVLAPYISAKQPPHRTSSSYCTHNTHTHNTRRAETSHLASPCSSRT
jgi:hypothetical protein